MSHAYVCDECKKLAPADENFGWWDVEAARTSVGALLREFEKAEYHFCSWRGLEAFARRMAAV